MLSAREWKPGDVALADGFFKGIIFRCLDPVNRNEAKWMTGEEGRYYGSARDVRPLVVIDPEDREQVERLARGWHAEREHAIRWEKLSQHDRDESIRTQQAALRSLITPPRPEEPTGLGAVVEDEDGVTWVRSGDGYWHDSDGGTARWDAVKAVKVLSEGVQ